MRISVIIPTFNRPEALKRALAALGRSSYSRDEFEVIVVDDGGRAALDKIVAGATEQGLPVKLIEKENGGPAGARNAGASVATGEFLAFTDDDCEPESGWLSALASTLAKRPDALAGGTVVNRLSTNLFAEASQAISDFCHSQFNSDPADCRFFPSNNVALSAHLYWSVGGFDPSFATSASEDREFCDRWRSKGLKLIWSRQAVVSHSHQMDLREFWRQQFGYGRGAVAYARARKRREGGSVPFEGWKFHLGILGCSFADGASPRAFQLSALICLSQAAVVLGYGWQWATSRIYKTCTPVHLKTIGCTLAEFRPSEESESAGQTRVRQP